MIWYDMTGRVAAIPVVLDTVSKIFCPPSTGIPGGFVLPLAPHESFDVSNERRNRSD